MIMTEEEMDFQLALAEVMRYETDDANNETDEPVKIIYKGKIYNIDVCYGTCTNCDNDVIYGDALDDFEFKYCPYCGHELME